MGHYSDLLYVHLQNILTSEDTVLYKRFFEDYIQEVGVKIRHNNADNGRFKYNAFMQ